MFIVRYFSANNLACSCDYSAAVDHDYKIEDLCGKEFFWAGGGEGEREVDMDEGREEIKTFVMNFGVFLKTKRESKKHFSSPTPLPGSPKKKKLRVSLRFCIHTFMIKL